MWIYPQYQKCNKQMLSANQKRKTSRKLIKKDKLIEINQKTFPPQHCFSLYKLPFTHYTIHALPCHAISYTIPKSNNNIISQKPISPTRQIA